MREGLTNLGGSCFSFFSLTADAPMFVFLTAEETPFSRKALVDNWIFRGYSSFVNRNVSLVILACRLELGDSKHWRVMLLRSAKCSHLFSRSIHTETRIYKTVAGCEIKADVLYSDVHPFIMSARSDSTALSPCIVYFHGGGFILGSRTSWKGIDVERDLLMNLLACNFKSGTTNAAIEHAVVVSMDYRLAPETPFASILEDTQDAIRWIVARHHELGISYHSIRRSLS